MSSSEALVLSGRTLGEFIVREKLGEGGFGAVFRAEQPMLGREAVIKVLHGKHRTSEVVIERFLRESKLASKLDHPYAAHVYSFGVEPDGLMWIAMELVRGTPMNTLLKTQGPIPLDRFGPLLDRLCQVIHAAHEAGIVHRDIKPGNVMVLSRSGRLLPKLLDFGIAKMGESSGKTVPRAELPSDGESTGTMPIAEGEEDPDATANGNPGSDAPAGITELGVAMGSPPYMAPEQWVDSAAVDSRTDLYALGVLVFECLAGKLPFTGRGREMARAHARAAVPPLGPGFPPALDAVMAKILAKKPAHRYPDALAFGAAFREAAGLTEHEPLPKLDETLQQGVLSEAPQPIAEAVAALDAARNPHQAREALWEVVRVAIRYVGLCALACRTRVGPGSGGDAPAVVERLRELRRRELDEREWLELTRELVRPFAAQRDAYPIPELVSLFGTRAADPLIRLATRDAEDSGSQPEAREDLGRLLPELAALLRALAFLSDYRLVVPVAAETADGWMGARRSRRPALPLTSAAPLGRAILCDFAGRPILSLWPLFQVAAPSPGAPEELFLFEGRGRRGARLVAMPLRFERQDEAVWDWFREHLLAADDGAQPDEAAPERAPYLGLSAFTRDDATRFFGRERQIEAFVNRLRTHALIAVVGPSGAGKSSFVQAGVLPSLPPSTRVITVRPGSAPLAALAARLAHEKIAAGDLTQPDALGAALRAEPAPIVLVVDQLEELFTLCLDPLERARYAQALAHAARSADDEVRVILTLRDDFLGRVGQLAALRDRLTQGLQLLTTPGAEELLRILVEPARRLGYEFDDPELPARVVAEVAEQPGALALLSFTAARLWELRDRHFKQLTRKAYDALGGVGGSLAAHAEETLGALGAEDQRLVREAFRHLVSAEGTRAVLSRAELRQLLGDPVAADRVVEKLVHARLLQASDGTDEDPQDRVEIIHEALLAAWPRLVGWRADDAQGARLRDQLRAAARQWDQRARPRGLLWRDEALLEYQVWRGHYPGALTRTEEDFGQTSLHEAARGRRARRAALAAIMVALVAGILVLVRANNAATHQQGRAEKAAGEAHRRLVAAHEESGRQALLGGDPMRAAVYLARAYEEGESSEALRFMLARAREAAGAAQVTIEANALERAISFSPDGQRLLTGGDDGIVRISDAGDGKVLATISAHHGPISAATFSPDGKLVLTASLDGTARLWDGATGAARRALDGHTDKIYEASFSADGARIVTASRDKTARVWDAGTGAQLAVFTGKDRQFTAELSADGTRAVTGSSEGALTVWEVTSGSAVWSTPDDGQLVDNASFTHDGGKIISASGNTAKIHDARDGKLLASLDAGEMIGNVWAVGSAAKLLFHAGVAVDVTGTRVATASLAGAILWDASGQILYRLPNPEGGAGSVAFSPDGKTLLVGGDDATIWRWDVASGRPLATFVGHQDSVVNLAFDPSGTRFVSSSLDRTAKVWELRNPGARASIAAGGVIWSVAFSPDDRLIATAGIEHVLQIWDVRTGALVRSFAGRPEINTVRFSSRGTELLVTRADSVVELLDAVTGKTLLELHEPARPFYAELDAHDARIAIAEGSEVDVRDARSGTRLASFPSNGALQTASFDPQGGRIATCSSEGTVQLWDAASGKGLGALPSGDLCWSAFWDPSGRRIVVASAQKTAGIYDVATGKLAVALAGHSDSIATAAFSPDGVLVATASSDRTARVWEATTGRELLRLIAGTAKISDLAFSHDGALLATASSDGVVQLWSMSPEGGSPADASRHVRCEVPFELMDDQLRPAGKVCQ